MPLQSSKALRPRELRRRVVIPARLRHGSSWSDACILNISSRGLMIHTGRPLAAGTEVEVRRGEHVIVARVVWRDGGRAGLQAEERVPIEDMLTVGKSPTQRVNAEHSEERSRSRGSSIEFAGMLVIAAFLAGAGMSMGQSAFAQPLARVAAALDR